MTTVSSLTGTQGTNLTSNMSFPLTQPQSSIMNVFEEGFRSSGYGMQGFQTQPQQTSEPTIPSALNDNPNNLASLILENHYAQAYQAYMLSEAQNQAQAQQTAQTTQQTAPQTTVSTPTQGSMPSFQDMYIASQIANTISSQHGCMGLSTGVNQGLPTDFLLQTTPQAGLNFSA